VLDDLGGSLSAAVRARVDEAVALAVDELRGWGLPPQPRDMPPDEPLGPDALALHAYESGRPSAAQACRIGDARFIDASRTGDPQ